MHTEAISRMDDGGVAAWSGRISTRFPAVFSRAALWCIDRAAIRLIRRGVTANSITVACAAVAAIAGVLLSQGCFGLAGPAMIVACLGDALDGAVARRSASASVGGALLDAAADRYGEFFFLAGLAVYFRGSVCALLLVLFALAGSYMVSYGSAKAEALRLPVPSGPMRRAERALCLCAGVTLSSPLAWMTASSLLPSWAPRVPTLSAIALVAVVANVSAIRRLRSLARIPRVVAAREGASDRRSRKDERTARSVASAPT